MTLAFRLARGVAVVLSIVATHAVIFWLFNTMHVPMPELAPVFATLMVEPEAEPKASPQGQTAVETSTASPAAPASLSQPEERAGSQRK